MAIMFIKGLGATSNTHRDNLQKGMGLLQRQAHPGSCTQDAANEKAAALVRFQSLRFAALGGKNNICAKSESKIHTAFLGNTMPVIHLYTDGACSGNPGPGGWGSVLLLGDTIRKLSGYEPQTTNNRMELQGVIKGLEALKRPCTVEITTDSKYVKNAFTEGWLAGWQRNGWKTSSREPVKNQDLWMIMCELQRIHSLSWKWVKGHSGDTYNEMCDQLARQAIIQRAGIDERNSQ